MNIVKVFKGNMLAHLACTLQREFLQLEALDCLITYFAMARCAWQVIGII